MTSSPDFVTMGDTNYFETMRLSVKQVQKYHPESKFFIYDWGLSSEELNKLTRFDGVEIIQEFSPGIKFGLIGNMQYQIGANLERYGDLMTQNSTFVNKILNKIKRKLGYNKFTKGLEILMRNKIQCLSDAATKTNGTFVFLDADAVIVDSVDVYDKYDFDIGVTLRSNPTISSEAFRVLNGGVIFFNTNSEQCNIFISNWESKMMEVDEEIPEQTALSKLIWESDNDIYNDYYNESIETLDGFEFIYKVLPCERYNYTSVEEGINKNENKIIHFKSDRHKYFNVTDIISKVEENNEYVPSR